MSCERGSTIVKLVHGREILAVIFGETTKPVTRLCEIFASRKAEPGIVNVLWSILSRLRMNPGEWTHLAQEYPLNSLTPPPRGQYISPKQLKDAAPSGPATLPFPCYPRLPPSSRMARSNDKSCLISPNPPSKMCGFLAGGISVWGELWGSTRRVVVQEILCGPSGSPSHPSLKADHRCL